MTIRSRRPLALAALAVGLVLAGCGGPTAPAMTDPVQILQKGAASLAALKTVHLRGTADGQLALDIGGLGSGGPLSIDGSTLDGDIDVAGKALSIEANVVSLLSLKVDLVAVGGSTYLKAPILTGGSWVRQPATGSVGGIGADPSAFLSGLSTFLARKDLAPKKLSDARCAGADCYEVQFTVPAAEVRAALGSLGSAIPGLSGEAIGDVTVTAGVRKDDLRLGTLGLSIPTAGAKPLVIAIELSKYDEPVTITAPPADQVKNSLGG